MLTALSFVLYIPSWMMPRDASVEGLALDQHLLLNLWVAIALLALLHVLLFTGVRLRRRAEARSSNLVEWIPLAAFTCLFAVLTLQAERLWAASRYTASDPAALQVEAVGMQFAWYFRYPGGDAAFGRTSPTLVDPGAGNPLGIDPTDTRGVDDVVTSELVLPVGREVDVHLRAQDVIHGFSLPAMRVKQNAVPGQLTHVHFTPAEPGTYAILCTQVCGLGHFRMTANLRVLSPADYASWLSAKQAAVSR